MTTKPPMVNTVCVVPTYALVGSAHTIWHGRGSVRHSVITRWTSYPNSDPRDIAVAANFVRTYTTEPELRPPSRRYRLTGKASHRSRLGPKC
jgi:hypothetical protein